MRRFCGTGTAASFACEYWPCHTAAGSFDTVDAAEVGGFSGFIPHAPGESEATPGLSGGDRSLSAYKARLL